MLLDTSVKYNDSSSFKYSRKKNNNSMCPQSVLDDETVDTSARNTAWCGEGTLKMSPGIDRHVGPPISFSLISVQSPTDTRPTTTRRRASEHVHEGIFNWVSGDDRPTLL